MQQADPHTDDLLDAFRRAAALPWYRTLLQDAGVVDPAAIVDTQSFTRLAPVLTKRNTFDRFPLHELAAGVSMRDLAGVLTSSGHGGRFSFGLISRPHAAAGGRFIDLALDAAFDIASRPTLAINCLPMGVGFSSERMTVATTSVREDMAAALVQSFGRYYEQIVLVADPLFMKRLLDHAADTSVDWTGHRMQAVLGEEVFGEHFRSYAAAALGLDADDPSRGYVMSSFGVGELGLHLCYETPATIAVRRTIARRPELIADLVGLDDASRGVPAVLTFSSARTFVEAVDPDDTGYGRLTVSMLDPELPIPLLRYQTGDRVRLLDAETIAATLARHGTTLPGPLPANLLALAGRDRDALPNGSHVAVYKDALYADPVVARGITGAFRLVFANDDDTMHVQLTRSSDADASLESRLQAVLPHTARPMKVALWPYDRFPFGMTVDYERKFRYV